MRAKAPFYTPNLMLCQTGPKKSILFSFACFGKSHKPTPLFQNWGCGGDPPLSLSFWPVTRKSGMKDFQHVVPKVQNPKIGLLLPYVLYIVLWSWGGWGEFYVRTGELEKSSFWCLELAKKGIFRTTRRRFRSNPTRQNSFVGALYINKPFHAKKGDQNTFKEILYWLFTDLGLIVYWVGSNT